MFVNPFLIRFTIVLSLFIFCSCNSKNSTTKSHFYSPKYAEGFYIDTSNNQTQLFVCNPNKSNQTSHLCYTLSLNPSSDYFDLPLNPKRIIALSSTHIAFLDLLQQLDKVVAIPKAENIYNPIILQEIKKGTIKEVGHETVLNIESVIALKPEIVLVYDIEGHMSTMVTNLRKMGVKVLYIGEYLESHPLGRLEWLMAFASLFDTHTKASHLFDSIEKRYLSQIAEVKNLPKRSVLLNIPHQEIWYLPGIKNYMSKLIIDAQGEHCIKLKEQAISSAYNFETILSYGVKAQTWLNAGSCQNLKQIKITVPLAQHFQSFQSGEVFNPIKRISNRGGNDFFESAVVQPDKILNDLIMIFHPTLRKEGRFHYYQQLK